MAKPPLVAHVIFALRMGGLENGVVNLVNRFPKEKFRSAIICVTEYDDFAKRINDPDIPIIALHKKPGKDPVWYLRLWKVLRTLSPDIVHTRNLPTVESQFIAWLAGTKGRVHSEHGWDTYDLGGVNNKYRLLRKILSPFINKFIALSSELRNYLTERVGVPENKVEQIINGVDSLRFHPADGVHHSALPLGFSDQNSIVIGTVGRMEEVKDPLNLVNAFIELVQHYPQHAPRLRLVMIGGGSLYESVGLRLKDTGLMNQVWLPGPREDVPELLRSMDIFALPSMAEGISNTILEAMSSGLPIVATNVGGNYELVSEGKNATLVAKSDSRALFRALAEYVSNREKRRTYGAHSRQRVEEFFSMEKMVKNYMSIYSEVLT